MTLTSGYVLASRRGQFLAFKGRHVREIEEITAMLHAVMEKDGKLPLEFRLVSVERIMSFPQFEYRLNLCRRPR